MGQIQPRFVLCPIGCGGKINTAPGCEPATDICPVCWFQFDFDDIDEYKADWEFKQAKKK